MRNSDIQDPLYLQAVSSIDSGDPTVLESLIALHPRLVRERLHYPSGDYFEHPFLLWFVADNPIRIERLPENIVEITRILIQAVKREGVSVPLQLDYALGLVATGRIPRECGVQRAMMSLLIDEGATPQGGLGALAHGNADAAAFLVERGAPLTLATAVGLDRLDDLPRLAESADAAEKLAALTVAAFYGKPHLVTLLLELGATPNGFPQKSSGFHSHATPLHQAVFSGSLEAVEVLMNAGASLDVQDRIHHGTPLGWAKHMALEAGNDTAAAACFDRIAELLRCHLEPPGTPP